MLTYRMLTHTDQQSMQALLFHSFGPGCYAKTAWRLRENVEPIYDLSWGAFATQSGQDKLVGCIQYWPVLIANRWSCLLLGPLAVHGNNRLQGVGLQLMQVTLEKAKQQGHQRVILVGDESYYMRAGFNAVLTKNLHFPGPVRADRLLGLSLLGQDSFTDVRGVVGKFH